MAQITSVDILQHNLNRFGMVTVLDAYLFDTVTNKLVMSLDTLKMSNVTAEGQSKEIKGGRYADILVSYNYGRTLNLEFQDALLSMASMKNLWGATITQDAIAYTGKAQLAYGTGITITTGLPEYVDAAGAQTATTGLLSVFNVTTGSEVTLGANATIATGKLTFTAGASATDELIIIYTAKAVYASGTHDYTPMQALISSSSFPKTVRFVGKSFLIEQATGKTVEVEIEIPRLKLASNFALTMEAEGDASVFDFSGMALVNGTGKDLLKIKTLKYLD